MSVISNEKIVDDPVMVNGKFVRNVGSTNNPNIYNYVYLKDGDKDIMKRMSLALKVGSSIGISIGILHVGSFGRNPKFPTKLDPFIRIAFSGLTGMAAMALHAGTVSLCSQLQGGRDLIRNWALAGGLSGYLVYSAVQHTPQRLAYLRSVPAILAAMSALSKVAVVYDKPLHGYPVTTYGMQVNERSLGPRHVDTLNPYRRQEEYYLEKFL